MSSDSPISSISQPDVLPQWFINALQRIKDGHRDFSSDEDSDWEIKRIDKLERHQKRWRKERKALLRKVEEEKNRNLELEAELNSLKKHLNEGQTTAQVEAPTEESDDSADEVAEKLVKAMNATKKKKRRKRTN